MTVKVVKATVLVLTLGVVVSLSSLSSLGTMQIARKEGVACTTCHVKMGSKELDGVGKCYAKKKSLKACRAVQKKQK